MSNFNIVKKVYQQMSSEKGCGCKKKKFQEGEMENPCEPGYIAYGTKEKDGKTVPNCIPEKEAMGLVKDGFPVPSPEGGEDEQAYVSRCIKELYDEYGQEQAAAICYSKWREK